MDQDLKALVTIAERLLEGSRKLARENASLIDVVEVLGTLVKQALNHIVGSIQGTIQIFHSIYL